nr:unnamed protein product [Fasciola hepatica]
MLSKHEGLHNTCNEAYQKRCGEYSKKYVGKTNCTKYPDGKCQNNDNETGKVPQTKIHRLDKQTKSKRNSNKRPKLVKTRKNATENSSLTRMSNLGKEINFKISSKKRRTIDIITTFGCKDAAHFERNIGIDIRPLPPARTS